MGEQEKTREELKTGVKAAVHALDEKLARDVEVIDIGGVTTIADYFVVASAGSSTQLHAMQDAVDEAMYKAGFGDIIVHLFSEEDRVFYNLEKIWQDGKKVDPESL